MSQPLDRKYFIWLEALSKGHEFTSTSNSAYLRAFLTSIDTMTSQMRSMHISADPGLNQHLPPESELMYSQPSDHYFAPGYEIEYV